MVTLGCSPRWYQVTIRVHSPASVGASSSPTSALSRVDFPALIFPAIASRSGPVSRADSSCSSAWARGPVAWAAAALSSRPTSVVSWSSTAGSRSRCRRPVVGGGDQLRDLGVDLPQLFGLRAELGHPGRSLRSGELHGLARRSECGGGRAVQRYGPQLEIVTEVLLGPAQRVAAFLVHDEADLFDVPPGEHLGLLPTVCHL